jgi:gas vesicle protein
MTTSSKVILGIIGAAAAGAVIGMLLAPEKGSDLRKRIKETTDDWASQLTDLFEEGKTEFQKVKNKASRAASTVKSEAEDRFNNVNESYS